MTDPSPHLLVEARRGAPAAADRLVRAWLPKVLGWCTRLGGPAVVEEDAAQDVMIVLLRRLDDAPDALGPWLYGVTRRVLSDHRRRAFVRRWLPGVVADLIDRGPRPDERLIRSEATREVQRILDTMPWVQREAFVLADIEGHTDVEVAALVGAPVGTVKSRLRLARARFAAALPASPDAARVPLQPATSAPTASFPGRATGDG
jgi:RNA polymerase sigma factor (sigma-70 family)